MENSFFAAVAAKLKIARAFANGKTPKPLGAIAKVAARMPLFPLP
jgi:hypothetical protein